MERNFRNFAESISNNEHTLFNINELRNPKMRPKLNPERGYAGRSIVNKYLFITLAKVFLNNK